MGKINQGELMLKLDLVERAVKMEYLLDKIVQSSEDCELSYAKEYVDLISKNDEFSVYLYAFCTSVARSKNHSWSRTIGRYYGDKLMKAYNAIILWKETDYDKETDSFHTPYKTLMDYTFIVNGVTWVVGCFQDNIHDYFIDKYKEKFDLEWKNIREEIILKRISRDFN